MAVHPYCIVPGGHSLPPGLRGLEDSAVRAVRAGALDVWVTLHPAPVAASADAARLHDAVVRAALTQQVTPVPLRFGQSFSTDAAVAEGVQDDAARWQTLLDRFAGRTEYGVRVMTTGQNAERDVHAVAAESGREYMASLARKQARAAGRRAEAERIHADLATRVGDLAADERVEHGHGGELLVSLAHLVARADAAAYHAALDAARDAWPGMRILLTGPWPPYSFVE